MTSPHPTNMPVNLHFATCRLRASPERRETKTLPTRDLKRSEELFQLRPVCQNFSTWLTHTSEFMFHTSYDVDLIRVNRANLTVITVFDSRGVLKSRKSCTLDRSVPNIFLGMSTDIRPADRFGCRCSQGLKFLKLSEWLEVIGSYRRCVSQFYFKANRPFE